MTPTLITPPPNLDPAVANLETVADLLEQLGDIPAHRVRWHPLPGTATEQDVIAVQTGLNKRLCELVDGTLIEKAAGFYESRVGAILGYYIEKWSEHNDIGLVFGPNVMYRVLPGRVRMPDISFVWWTQLPKRKLIAEPIAPLVPDLAVEVLSEGNSRREMENKRGELFHGGARLVWEITSHPQSARVYININTFQDIGPDGALDGGEVMPGFVLPLRKLFARAEYGA